MKYSVLVKRIVNVRIDGIEAHSQESAIQAADELEFCEIVGEMQRQTARKNSDGTPIRIRYVEDGDETSCYLVDEEGDREFHSSRWYGKDGKTVLDATDRCSECLRICGSPSETFDKDIAALMSANLWAEHPEYPRLDWRTEVGLGHTQLGYWGWVQHQVEARRKH